MATRFLSAENLEAVIDKYKIPAENNKPKKVGIVMAGNIPLVGFHDMLCTFWQGITVV
jgi:hypothetical protein